MLMGIIRPSHCASVKRNSGRKRASRERAYIFLLAVEQDRARLAGANKFSAGQFNPNVRILLPQLGATQFAALERMGLRARAKLRKSGKGLFVGGEVIVYQACRQSHLGLPLFHKEEWFEMNPGLSSPRPARRTSNRWRQARTGDKAVKSSELAHRLAAIRTLVVVRIEGRRCGRTNRPPERRRSFRRAARQIRQAIHLFPPVAAIRGLFFGFVPIGRGRRPVSSTTPSTSRPGDVGAFS